MTVAGLIFLITGFLMEALWLLNNGGSPKRPGWLHYFPYIEGGILALGIFSAGLAALLGKAQIVLPLDVAILIMAVLFVSALVIDSDSIAYAFLPQVSEQSILVIQFIFIITFIQENHNFPILYMLPNLALPLIIILWLVASKKKIHSVMKIFLYIWYLILLFVLTYTCWQSLLSKNTSLSPGESFFLGVYFCFLLVHFQLLIRIKILFKNLLVDFDREFAKSEINTFFFDDQVSLLPFLIFILSTSGTTYFLYHFQVPQAGLWANIMIILIVQVLFNPHIRYWFEHKLSLVD